MNPAISEAAPITCSRCGAPLGAPPGPTASADTLHCPRCKAVLRVETFPALYRAEATQSGDLLQREGEASCFYHPDKRAEVLCSTCGRFLCTLCDIPVAGRRLCPLCFERARHQEQMPELVSNRVLYDSIALSLAILPLLFFPLTIFTAPMAIYMSMRHWKSPSSLLPRTKIRFIAAILIAGLQIAGWIAVLSFSLR